MTAMWSMPVVLTETENENDSANQNDVAKMTSQCRMETAVVLCTNPLIFFGFIIRVHYLRALFLYTQFGRKFEVEKRTNFCKLKDEM